MHSGVRYILYVLLAAAFTGCSLVDEDLRDCGKEYSIEYSLTLVTNVSDEIASELETPMSTGLEISAANALREYLKNIFTDYAHDVHLSFYDVAEDSLLLHREEHIMDASHSSYTLYMPERRYMHTALANVNDNPLANITGDDRCHREKLHQPVQDTLSSHTTGLFTARLPMDIQEGQDRNFYVRLYMANSAAAIVIDTTGSNIRDLKLFSTGFATDFSVCDSLYHFNGAPVFRMDSIPLTDNSGCCFASVNFPSRNPFDSKVVIDSQDSFVTEQADEALWCLKAYVTMPDGSVTESVLGVNQPLHAGELKILKAKVIGNGAVQPDDPTVGVSITLEWGGGMDIPIDL